jgi:hypothetical protein
MTGVLRYSGASSTVNERYNEYYTTLSAAEAATEGVIAKMARDFQSGGSSTVDGSLGNYRFLVPTAAEVGEWANYEFADASGVANQTYVQQMAGWQYTSNNWKYPAFFGSNATYRIISNTRNTVSGNNIIAAVKQDIQLSSIPLFEFGVFYALEMEFHPAQNMTLTGRIHCNTNIYCAPSNPTVVTFAGDVTSAHEIRREPNPDDPSTQTPPFAVSFLGAEDWNVGSLNLPIGTNNTDTELHKIIEIPPPWESPSSLMGQQRYYNKADLIILVTNGIPVAMYGNHLDAGSVTNFVTVATNTFHDVRENADIQCTEINIQAFTQYSALGSPKIIYVADLRNTVPPPSVRIIKGQTLPGALTVATMNPLYVVGDYNAPTPGTNTGAQPASLVCDAITIVSSEWKWTNSAYGNDPRNRNAVDTTINAAIIAGIVPTDGGSYSGGVENYLRLLEDWRPGSPFTLTFNGSIVALFSSKIATGQFENWLNVMATDADSNMLPNRQFNFDQNFKTLAKLPPGTPYLRTLIRGEWAITKANSSL